MTASIPKAGAVMRACQESTGDSHEWHEVKGLACAVPAFG